SLGHDADDRIDSSLHLQLKFRQIRGSGEVSLPVAVAHDGRGGSMETLFLRHKSAAANRLGSKNAEEILGYDADIDSHGFASAGNRGKPILISSQTGQSVVLGQKIIKVQVREIHAMSVRRLLPHANDLWRIGIRERPQENGIDHRKDR